MRKILARLFLICSKGSKVDMPKLYQGPYLELKIRKIRYQITMNPILVLLCNGSRHATCTAGPTEGEKVCGEGAGGTNTKRP